MKTVPRVTKTCATCGGDFQARAREVETRPMKFCSKACHLASMPLVPPEHRQSPTYNVWNAMRQRCQNTGHPSWPRYGARGISVCERWGQFGNFLADMGPKPDGLTLDRIDNNGNYEPKNCRWATRTQQQGNMRSNVLLTHDGRTECVERWGAITGIPARMIHWRITHGWTAQEALTKPTKKYPLAI